MSGSSSSEEKRIIAIPFAFEEGMNTGVNIRKEGALDLYLQNLCVASASAKYRNPDCTVAVVTNLNSDKLPAEYAEVLRRFGVEVIERPFDRFRFSDDYRWSLAFYKLCALSYLAEMDYDKICYCDADVYFQGTLGEAWEKCGGHLLLYDLKHGRGKLSPQFGEEVKAFLKTDAPADHRHFGGEFYMADRGITETYLGYVGEVYRKMAEDGFKTKFGDEFIVCLAADNMEEKMIDAGSYIYRFWTGINYRMVSDKYREIPILHMPDEKGEGFPCLYRRYIRRGTIPENRAVWKICRLDGVPVKDRLKKLIASR